MREWQKMYANCDFANIGHEPKNSSSISPEVTLYQVIRGLKAGNSVLLIITAARVLLIYVCLLCHVFNLATGK